MTNEEKYEHWEDIAKYDLESAKAMYKSGRYLYVVFMCQQSIEKLIKGLHVLYTGEEPIRTHNIWVVFSAVFENDHTSVFDKETKNTKIFSQSL
jgi:HEPN domain-containing protein